MTFSTCLKTIAAATIIAACPNLAVAQDAPAKVGELSALTAWANKFPPGPFVLNAKGQVTAPTPCYEATAEYAGEDKSNPPIYRVKVAMIQKPGNCIQKLTNIHFQYVQPNYTGTHEKMDIFSDKDAKIIPIDVIQ